MCSFTGWKQALGMICSLDPVCVFLADILLIQNNTGTPADPLVVCPGGQPETERKKERKMEGERQVTSFKYQLISHL